MAFPLLSRFSRREPGLLIWERATLPRGRRLTWTLTPRGEQQVAVEWRGEIAGLDGQPGLEVSTLSRCRGRTFSYLRGLFSLDPGECNGTVSFELDLALLDAPDVLLAVALYEDPELLRKIHSDHVPVRGRSGRAPTMLNVDFRRVPIRGSRVHGFVQVCLPREAGARVWVGQASALALDFHEPRPGLSGRLAGLAARLGRRIGLRHWLHPVGARAAHGPRIRFEPLGDRTQASSRLRVWKLVDQLRHDGRDLRVWSDGTDVDILFCQKTRPFDTVREVRLRNPAALVVYDFDDHFLLEERGVLPELLAFVNQADVVTCGSEYLAERVRPWHPNVRVLDNPLDVENPATCRPARGALTKIGWFGAPEGLLELSKVRISAPVTTLTRGGDIEFDQHSVDARLTAFDLVVLPLEPTPWNLAKNANRMMKALALGVPVLASATPEHARVAAATGLPPECLVHSPDDWDAAIERVRAAYGRIEQATLQAREKLWQSHTTRDVLSTLLGHLDETRSRPVARSKAPALGQVAVLLVDGSPLGRGRATVEQSRVDWSAFHSAHLLCAQALAAEALGPHGRGFRVISGDFLGAFSGADRAVAECEAEYLLVVPAGTALAFGIAREIERAVQSGAELTLFARNRCHSAQRVGVFPEPRLRSLFLDPTPPGPLLVKTAWARQHAPRWEAVYELWPWAATVKAWAQRVPTTTIELPLAFECDDLGTLTPPEQYAAWLEQHRPEVAREQPDAKSQWARMFADIVGDLALDLKDELPGLVGHLYSQHVEARETLASGSSRLSRLVGRLYTQYVDAREPPATGRR